MRWIPAPLIVLSLLVAACGSSADTPVVVETTTTDIFGTTTTAAPAPAQAPATTTEAVYEAPSTTTAAPEEASTATTTTAEVSVTAPESVTVEEGDSLSKIAKRYGTTVDVLVRINEMCDPNQIFVGQVILLADPDATATEADEAGDVLIVTVEAGDSLSKIAKRHNTTVEEIMSRNAIEDPNLLFVGQDLVIDGEVAEDEEPEENPYC